MRYIVADCSVLLAAYFDEELEYRGNRFDVSRRAKPIRRLIHQPHVSCFAPDLLLHEFMSVAASMLHGRVHRRRSSQEVEAAVEDFRSLPITFVPASEVAGGVWELLSSSGISSADVWYLECARHVGAELWLSHHHTDGFVEQARSIYGADRVRVLTESKLDE